MIDQILDELKEIRVAVESQLMSQRECAQYMNVSLRHFREHYAGQIEWLNVGKKALRCTKKQLLEAIKNDINE